MIQHKMNVLYSFIIYVSAALLMWVQTHFTIPYFSQKTGEDPVLFWFIVGALGIFLPLVITAVIILKTEGLKLNADTWHNRMRFIKMNVQDWKWGAVGVLASGIGTVLIMATIHLTTGKLNYTPTFMEFEPLSSGRYWLLAVWFVFWIFNIMGEEILWRGVMLPAQEKIFGKQTWIVQGMDGVSFTLPLGGSYG